MITWYFINIYDIGNIYTYLFALTCCYYPYNYMAGAELSIGKTNQMTNLVHNYSIVGYALFGFLANFTSAPILVINMLLIILTWVFIYRGLPEKLYSEYLSLQIMDRNSK